jgi:hypothetical protein
MLTLQLAYDRLAERRATYYCQPSDRHHVHAKQYEVIDE